MEDITLNEVLEAVKGQLINEGILNKFNVISTDTRKIEEGSIFIALKGENFNGNEFILEAIKKGAALCIIDELKFPKESLDINASIIKVENTKTALLMLAEYYRSTLPIKIIGLTGSTGKTTTKDITSALLMGKYKVFKTQGNFNNEIGLPLMIFNLDKSYEVAVLEMGMSNLNEIHNMSKAAKPDIALITNIGVSHLENLKTRQNILKAKMEITHFFQVENTLILNVDNDLLSEASNEERNYNLIKTGTTLAADYVAKNIILTENSVTFDVYYKEKLEYSGFKLNIPGKHNVLNAILAIAAAKLLGVTYEQMQEGLKTLTMTSMRLDIIKGRRFTLIDDCYNASPDSMKAAIDVLNDVKGKRKLAIVGTMRELGDNAYELHKEIGEYLKNKRIDCLITTGEFENAYKDGYDKSECFYCFESIDKINEFLKGFLMEEDVVMVKASRSMKFEKIVNEIKTLNF